MAKPTEEQLNQWFNTFWTSYPADLCKGKRGGKIPGMKAFKNVAKSEEEFNRIMANMKAQIKADRSEKDPYRWPFVSSYLNQHRFDDYIMQKSESRPVELKTCSVDGCNHDVHGEKYIVCSMHIPCQHDERLRAAWKKTGISRTSPTMRADCLEYLNSIGMGGYVKLIGVSDE